MTPEHIQMFGQWIVLPICIVGAIWAFSKW